MSNEERINTARLELRNWLTDIGVPFEFAESKPHDSFIMAIFKVDAVMAKARVTNTMIDLEEILRGLEPPQ